MTIPLSFLAGILVGARIILEIKAVAALLTAHEAQLLTNLRMGRVRVGLLVSVRACRLKDGLPRLVA